MGRPRSTGRRAESWGLSPNRRAESNSCLDSCRGHKDLCSQTRPQRRLFLDEFSQDPGYTSLGLPGNSGSPQTLTWTLPA